MSRLGRVGDRATHAALRRSRHRAQAGPVGIAWLDDGAVPPRVAFALPRRLGTAVLRNRLRRRVRAALAGLDLGPGTYLVTVTPAAAEVAFDQLSRDVAAAVAQACR